MAHFIFLVCSERSGSNFITSLMNGHPLISGPPPSHLFRLFGTNMDRYGDLSVDATWELLISDVVGGFDSMLGDWNTSVSFEELKAKAECRTSAELLRIAYEKEAEHDGASHVVVKENHAYRMAPYLMAHFPGCRFLIVARDPRDVASSWVSTDTIPDGVERAVDTWLQDQHAALALYHQLRGSGRTLILRYEDVLTETEAVLRRVTKWMGLAYDSAMIDFHREPRTRRNAQRIDAWANLEAPVLKNNAGKHRNVLSTDDIRFVELCCWELMEVLGYTTSEVEAQPSEPARAEEIQRLRSVVSRGRPRKMAEEEAEIRDKRLHSINSILARRPTCVLGLS